MTSWLVGHTDRFRAATAVAAVVDQTSMVLTTEIPEFAVFNMGGLPWSRRHEYETRSPLTYLPNVKTPVLVIHWEGDLRVPIGQGEELYSGLRLLGKKAEMVRYPGRLSHPAHPVPGGRLRQADSGLGRPARRTPEKAGAHLTS